MREELSDVIAELDKALALLDDADETPLYRMGKLLDTLSKHCLTARQITERVMVRA